MRNFFKKIIATKIHTALREVSDNNHATRIMTKSYFDTFAMYMNETKNLIEQVKQEKYSDSGNIGIKLNNIECQTENLLFRVLANEVAIEEIFKKLDNIEKLLTTPSLPIAPIASKVPKVPKVDKKSMKKPTLVDELILSPRALRCLTGSGITRIDELTNMSAKELLRLTNFGMHSLESVKKALERHGLKLRDDYLTWVEAMDKIHKIKA